MSEYKIFIDGDFVADYSGVESFDECAEAVADSYELVISDIMVGDEMRGNVYIALVDEDGKYIDSKAYNAVEWGRSGVNVG